MTADLTNLSIKVLCSVIDDVRLKLDSAIDQNAKSAVPALTCALHVLVSGLDQILASDTVDGRVSREAPKARQVIARPGTAGSLHCESDAEI